FLAYLVGTRANLGQLPQGWRDMLDHAAPSPPMFGLSLCDLRAAQGRTGPEPCPEKERQILPFPQALAGFLVANHYLTSDQAAILPVVLPPAAPPQGNASALPAGQFPAGQPPVGQSPVDQSPVGHSPVGHSLVGQSLAGQDQAAFSGADGRGHARYWPDFSCKLPPWNDAIATMLCQSSEAARHELMFDQVYYALRQTMGSGALGSLTQDVLANENAAYQRCGLPLPGQPSRSLPANAVPCYAAAMDRLAEHYRQRLSGPAREESARPLETHIAVQHKLVALGYLPAAMVEDGVYGAPTRHAIMTWQRIRQSPRVDGLLSDTEAALLLSAPMALPPPSEMLADAAAPGGAADTASDGAPNGAPNGGSNAASNGAPGSTRQAAQMVDNAAPESGPESVEEQGEDAAGSSGGGQPSPVGGVQAAAGSGLATASATGAVGGPETIPDSGFDDAAQDDATPPVSGLSSLSGPSLSVSAPSGAGRHAPFRQALVLVVSALGLCLYFAPFAVACRRDIDRKGMVLGVNLLLGWSVIGWAVALAMALSGQRRRRSGQIILP
ncbi:superinfection immunity protein, partial [Acetobacter sp.]